MTDDRTRPVLTIPIKTLPHATGLPLPDRATAGAAGVDLHAAVTEPVMLAVGARTLVPTGLTMAIPVGYEGQVRPRSGLALRYGVTVLNAPGTIDSDYRGEVGVILINLGEQPFTIERGMRIAQLVIAPTLAVVWRLVDGHVATSRGAGGFGSTQV